MDEWDQAAEKYVAVFKPRFQPIYDIITDMLLKHVCVDTSNGSSATILDYAAGPGEPSMTIMSRLSNYKKLKLITSDWSAGMLRYAQKSVASVVEEMDTNVTHDILLLKGEEPEIVNQVKNLAPLQAITASLVLMYIEDRNAILQCFHSTLSSDGVLIASHWCHPKMVPFLRILKNVNAELSRGPGDPALTEDERVAKELSGNTGSSALWDELKTRALLEQNGFEIVEWKQFQLDTTFDTVWNLLEFSESCSWWKDDKLKKKGIALGEEMVAKELGVSVEDVRRGPFTLQNQCVVFAARKKCN
jgi:SAM-dependent methyltransferase